MQEVVIGSTLDGHKVYQTGKNRASYSNRLAPVKSSGKHDSENQTE